MENKNWFKETWGWLDGKKTTIGTIIWAVAGGLKFVPALKPYSDLFDFSMEIGYAIALGGIGHKALKTETGQKILNKFIKK